MVTRMRNSGNNANFTVRRIASTRHRRRAHLPDALTPPREMVIERHSQVRRAQLYFLRGKTGKSSRLKQQFTA